MKLYKAHDVHSKFWDGPGFNTLLTKLLHPFHPNVQLASLLIHKIRITIQKWSRNQVIGGSIVLQETSISINQPNIKLCLYRMPHSSCF